MLPNRDSSRKVQPGCTNPARKLGQYAVTAHTLAYARGDGRGKVHPGCTAFGSRGLAEPRVRKVRTGAGAVILQLFLRFLGVIV